MNLLKRHEECTIMYHHVPCMTKEQHRAEMKKCELEKRYFNNSTYKKQK